MRKRVVRVLVIGAAVATPLVGGVGPAMAAGNPNYTTTPAAGPAGGGVSGNPGQVCTYQAPPAQGGAAPGSSAAGGSPGYESNKCVTTG